MPAVESEYAGKLVTFSSLHRSDFYIAYVTKGQLWLDSGGLKKQA